MTKFYLYCYDNSGKCIKEDRIDVERDALAKFHQYKDNTIKAHIALDNAGLPTDCLAVSIVLETDGAFVDGWTLSRNSDGMIETSFPIDLAQEDYDYNRDMEGWDFANGVSA